MDLSDLRKEQQDSCQDLLRQRLRLPSVSVRSNVGERAGPMDGDGKPLESSRESSSGGTHFGRSLQLRLLWIASSLLLGLLLLGALADAYLRPLPGSTTDDEIQTPASRQAFFQEWQAGLARL
ncbi:hypothetical protein, partial [Methylacidimicrobium tartarophylax]|uniref:hypothetical protein n=1 Tax=Methylacidimicrobium tartarophylax TaxID=1041768 RepID=UPI00115A40BE